MFGDPVVPTLSPRDRATVELAYHLQPNLSIAPTVRLHATLELADT